MGGVRRKKTRKNTTIKILRNCRKRKRTVKIGDKTMEQHWDHTKTLQQNMRSLGLAYDPNTSMKRRKKMVTKDGDGDETMEEKPVVNTAVIKEFEKQASNIVKHERHVSPDEAKFLMKLMKSHQEDYEKMCKDKRNTQQHTANQLRKKVEALLVHSLYPKYQEMFPELSTESMETV